MSHFEALLAKLRAVAPLAPSAAGSKAPAVKKDMFGSFKVNPPLPLRLSHSAFSLFADTQFSIPPPPPPQGLVSSLDSKLGGALPLLLRHALHTQHALTTHQARPPSALLLPA